MREYRSKYSLEENYVTAAQYITELICEKKALYENRILSYHFWKTKEWKEFFKQQIPTANKLLEKYSAKAIIMAIRDKRSYNTYSLRSPQLIKIIEEKQKEIDSKPVTQVFDYNETDPKKPTKPSGKQSLLDKLRSINGKTKED